jgi:hypothetical protein
MTYVAWIKRFILFQNKRHPASMGVPEIRAFLSHLALERNGAASTQRQASNAIVFLYREILDQEVGWLGEIEKAKRPERLPVVFSRPEVRAIRAHLDGLVLAHGEFTLWSRFAAAGVRALTREGCRFCVSTNPGTGWKRTEGPRYHASHHFARTTETTSGERSRTATSKN